MTARHRMWIVSIACVILIAGVWTQSPVGQQQAINFGGPMAGLLPAEFEHFRVGLDDFLEAETSEEGLGPAFNANSCAVCHNVPAIGGVSLVSEVRAAFREDDGRIRPLSGADGAPLDTLFHLFSIPAHSCQPAIPPEANIIARRVPIPVFGAGLVEAIPDEVLLGLADPEDRDGDGISGRAPVVIDIGTGKPRVGRFGWKSQHATLRTFSADAYRNEMGITNELFPQEVAAGISPAQLQRCDAVRDPEDVPDRRTRLAAIDNFEAFLKFLAPPPRGSISELARAGERAFSEIGCTACHVPVLETGSSRHPLFDRKPVPLFSDLLLHDIGTGDGIPQASALPHEIRTPALWGLRVRRLLLHDGSASTPQEAVERHRGEAESARRLFEQLDPGARGQLLAFLNSL